MIFHPNFKVYARESKRVTFNHRITSLRESAPIENQNQMELTKQSLPLQGAIGIPLPCMVHTALAAQASLAMRRALSL